MGGKIRDETILAYWLTACDDMQRESGGCQNCAISKECKNLRFKIFGRDILKKRKFKMRGLKITESLFLKTRTIELEEERIAPK